MKIQVLTVFYFSLKNIVLWTGQSSLALPEESFQEFKVNYS